MMEIVSMTAAHVPGVAALERRCFADPWSEASIAAELENPLSLWFTAVLDGELIGYIGAQAVLDEADVMNVAVAPERRGQGVGLALLRTLEEALRAREVCALSLEVRPSNAAALALYGRAGFQQAGRRPNYYRNPREDALILRKEWKL